MPFHDQRNLLLLLLRLLTPLLGDAIMPDMSYVVGLELVRIAALQAYLANAGVLVPRSLWTYCANSPSLGQMYVLLLTIQSRGMSAHNTLRQIGICAGEVQQPLQRIDTS
jgi:hypothetical protein